MAPRWIVRLVARVVPADRHDDVVGDLEELHGRRVDRWGSVLGALITVVDGSWMVVSHAACGVAGALFGGNRWVSGMEIRLALRLIRKQPVMTLTSVVALGTGIGMAAGGYSVFRQAIFSDLPFENGDRWVVLASYSEETGDRTSLDLERLNLIRTSAPAIEYVAGAEVSEFNVVYESGEVERISGARVTPGTFAYLPYVPLLGRLLVHQDGLTGAERVAIIRESLWERRFSRSPDILGQPLNLAGASYLIVGVLPDDAGYPNDGEIWIAMDEETMGAVSDRGAVGGRLIAILSEGATLDRAAAQIAQLSARVSAAGRGVEAQRHTVTPMTRMLVSPQIEIMILIFMAVLVTVLLIIAANVANLIVARTSRRSSELAVRTAMGASRSRLVGQLFVEVLVLGAIAAVPGLMLAGGILAAYDRVLDEMPFWIHLHLDPATAVAVVFMALLASGVMGVIPALRATRKDPAEALRAAGRGASLGIGRIGGAMILAEVALSVALLGTAAVYAKGFQSYVDPSFHLPDDRVLTARIVMDVEASHLVEGGASTVEDSIMIAVQEIQRAVATLPGVLEVGVASHLPRVSPVPEPLELEGRADVVPTPIVDLGPGLFEVLEVDVTLGRSIVEADLRPEAPPVVVVNEAFALENFGTTQVLGRRLRRVPEGGAEALPWRTIVGVVPNVMEVTGPVGGAGVYYPFSARRFFTVAVRVDSDPLALTGLLRRAVFDVDPQMNISDIVRLDEVGAGNRIPLAVMSSALTAIGIITLLLSLAGVYSIVSLAVTQRTREIGVRVALGAEPGEILWSILRRSGLLILGGAIIGALVGFQGTKVRMFVFVTPEPGAWLYPGLVALMGLAGVLACWLPARRALAIQPVEALRYDS